MEIGFNINIERSTNLAHLGMINKASGHQSGKLKRIIKDFGFIPGLPTQGPP